jgi:acetyl esterase
VAELHPAIQAALALGANARPYSEMPIEQARAQARLAYPRREPPVAVESVRDIRIAGPGGDLPLRIYQPPGNGPHPALVYFHGSGFVVLDLDTHDDLCRRLCSGASCVVVSVDYRLAPEHKFPAAPDDCLAATRWVGAQAAELRVDAARIGVAGDSAGGCLAAVTAMRVRDEGGPALCAQALFYPVTDYPTQPRESYRLFGDGYGFKDSGNRWYWAQYLPSPDVGAQPLASPLRMPSLAGLPSAYVMVAEYDLLRDEGEAFARRLAQAGIATEQRRSPGVNHGFLKYTGVVPEADATLDHACAWLRRVLRVDGGPGA